MRGAVSSVSRRKKRIIRSRVGAGVLEAGVVALAGYGVYYGCKWIVAAIFAMPTGGGSLIIAGVTPEEVLYERN